MKKIVIVGAGGFAKEVALLIDDINEANAIWDVLGYIDEKVGDFNGKYPIVGNDDWLLNYKDEINVVFGIGSPQLTKKLVAKFSINSNIKYPNLIHPNAIGDWERIELGKGNIICASNTFTTDIQIGNFNIFNLDCTLGHDSIIGDCNVFNPSVNISGGFTIGSFCLIGTAVTILQYIAIGDNITVGAAALVTKKLEIPGTYIGSPAKILNK